MKLKVVYLFLIIFLIAFYFLSPTTMDKEVITALLAVAGVSILLFAIRKEPYKALKGRYIRHSTLVLLGLIIVFFQVPLDYLLGNISSNEIDYWVNNAVVVKSLSLSVIGLLCFLLGYLIYHTKSRRIKEKYENVTPVNFLILLAAVALIVYFLTVNPLYFAGYYGTIELSTNSRIAISSFQLLIYASVIQICRNIYLKDRIPATFFKYIKEFPLALTILTGVYLLSVLVSGDRGPLIYYSLLILSGYFLLTKRRIRFLYLLLLVGISASFISFLAKVRNASLKQYDFVGRVEHAFDIKDAKRVRSISPATAELAGSYETLNTAVNYVPQKHDFFYGRFQFQRLGQIIPFFSTYFPFLFKDYSPQTDGSSSFITWINQGYFPKYGEGTSCLADLYLDFGLLGVIIGMFFWGYFMRSAEEEMYLINTFPILFMQIFLMVYLSTALYISRSVIFGPLRNIVWIYCILKCNNLLYRQFFKPKMYKIQQRL